MFAQIKNKAAGALARLKRKAWHTLRMIFDSDYRRIHNAVRKAIATEITARIDDVLLNGQDSPYYSDYYGLDK